MTSRIPDNCQEKPMSKVKTMIAGTLALAAATLALGVSVAFADKLSDFKEADRL
jgi:hypothetical protein